MPALAGNPAEPQGAHHPVDRLFTWEVTCKTPSGQRCLSLSPPLGKLGEVQFGQEWQAPTLG